LKLADEIEEHILQKGARPAFPANLSINDAAAHFSPDSSCELTFKRGDVAKIDCGAQIDGYIGDSAITVEIGTNERMFSSRAPKWRFRKPLGL
jgi:Methionine aminopeptidase